ncbi:MAG TPA: HlyD family efflux transporter periplasmic adaptor subunit [Candidatus Eisenbacteria bacterium]
MRTRPLELRRFDDVVVAQGQWRSSGDLPVAAPFAAVVESLGPRVGDRVRSGERIGWLVTRESRAALRGAEVLTLQARDPASREEAARALELARRDLVRVPILAPATGVVTRRAVEPGGDVGESGEILVLIPSGALVFEAHVPAREAARLKPGQRATIAEPNRPPQVARLQRLLPVASAGDQTTLAWLVPIGNGVPPTLDRFGSATLVVGAPRRAVAAPDSAVVEDDVTGATRIAVVTAAGQAVWIPVTLGATVAGWREIRAPALAAGTPVIVEGQHGLPDSTAVTIGR